MTFFILNYLGRYLIISVLFFFPLFQCSVYFFHLKINSKNNIFVQGRENKMTIFLIFGKIILFLRTYIVTLLSKHHTFSFCLSLILHSVQDLWVGSVCIVFCLTPDYFLSLC